MIELLHRRELGNLRGVNMRRFLLLVPIAAAVLTAAMGPAVYAAGGNVIYDSTVSPLPGNVPSVGAEAYSGGQG
jgi:hypothetical protein